MNLKFIAQTYPTPDFPYFGARIAVEGLGADLTVARCEVDGAWIRDVFVFNDAEECRKGILRAAANHAELRVRTDARQNDRPHILLTFSSGETLALDTPAVGPAAAWPLPEWRYCAAVVLSNTTALDRGAEPVHQPMAVYLDRLADPVREVRVLEVAEETGAMREIPSQVYHVSRWSEFADEHCQPTVNFDVAFLSRVRASGRAVYLVFYGNPAAEKPVYETDLTVSGEGMAKTIENLYYKVRLHPLSCAIDEVTVRQGVDQTFAHHLETNGAMELTQDRDVIALRSGEVVMSRELAQEVAWRNMDGTVTTTYIQELPRHPVRGQYLPAATPWVAVYDRKSEACLGISYIETSAIRRGHGLPRVDQHIYVHIGPWIYVARPLLYTFVGNNPQRVMHAYGDTLYYEKMAWNPMRLHYGRDDAFDELEDATENLRTPVQTQVFLDTDVRVPTEWVPPILLAEFEELE